MSVEESLMELSKLFIVTSTGEDKYLVEEANPDSEYPFFASYYKGEWTYSMSGIGNHGTDWVDIDIDRLEKLKEFCEQISGKTKEAKEIGDEYTILGKCYSEARDKSPWLRKYRSPYQEYRDLP